MEMDKQMKLQTHGSFVQQSRDAEDVIVTDVRHGAFDDTLAALQTPVALERIPRPLAVDPMEHVQLPDPGYQHQLYREDEEGRGGMEAITKTQVRRNGTRAEGVISDVTQYTQASG